MKFTGRGFFSSGDRLRLITVIDISMFDFCILMVVVRLSRLFDRSFGVNICNSLNHYIILEFS
jgi:hypothetical protein